MCQGGGGGGDAAFTSRHARFAAALALNDIITGGGELGEVVERWGQQNTFSFSGEFVLGGEGGSLFGMIWMNWLHISLASHMHQTNAGAHTCASIRICNRAHTFILAHRHQPRPVAAAAA
jgi:hypothetical protein